MNAAATSVDGAGGVVVVVGGVSVVVGAAVVVGTVVEASGDTVVFGSSVGDVSATDVVVVGVRLSDDVDVSVEHDAITTATIGRTTSRRIATSVGPTPVLSASDEATRRMKQTGPVEPPF
jgi:hypothetical protein